uniref:Uncharacterized protein n=1 Tax=Romanomermis culicivorax TaxID=13658 RepID=A0A915IGT9_ROMCU
MVGHLAAISIRQKEILSTQFKIVSDHLDATTESRKAYVQQLDDQKKDPSMYCGWLFCLQLGQNRNVNYDMLQKYFDTTDYQCMETNMDSIYQTILAENLLDIVKPGFKNEFLAKTYLNWFVTNPEVCDKP